MRTRASLPAVVGVLLGAAIAIFLAALVIADSGSVLEGPTTYLPLVALVTTPVVLGVIGLQRPQALLAAGMVSLPLSVLSLAGATLPLLVPAILYFIGYGSTANRDSRVSAITVALLGLGLGVGGYLLLATGGENVCSKTVRYPNGETQTFRTSSSESGTLTPPGRGPEVIATGCREEPAAWAGTLTVGMLAAGIWLVVYSSGSRVTRNAPRPT